MIEKMSVSDLDEVLAIETALFSNPWSRGMFLSELSGHAFQWAYVEKAAGQVIAYILFRQVLDELCLMDMAVHPARRRQGIGEHLIRFALRLGEIQGAVKMTLEVRASNLAAQCLYRTCGFQQVGLRRNYYSAPKEDALLFDCPIQSTSGAVRIRPQP